VSETYPVGDVDIGTLRLYYCQGHGFVSIGYGDEGSSPNFLGQFGQYGQGSSAQVMGHAPH